MTIPTKIKHKRPYISLLDLAIILKCHATNDGNRFRFALREIRRIERQTKTKILEVTDRPGYRARYLVDRAALKKAAPLYFRRDADEVNLDAVTSAIATRFSGYDEKLNELRKRDEMIAQSLREMIDKLSQRVQRLERFPRHP
jgi:hypothetical protein